MDDHREERGFQPIGSLTKQAANSLSPTVSTPTPSPRNSATIGLVSPAARDSRPIGRQHGEIAVVRSPGAEGKLPSPAQVDQNLLASLPRSVASALRERIIDRSTPEYGWDCEFVGYYQIDAPEADVAEALMQTNATLIPVPGEVVKAELARLKVTTKSRAESGDDLKLTLAAYAEYLAEYPADVVVDALRWWARNEKWWPAWAELKELLDRRVRRRKALKLALTDARGARAKAV